MQQNPIPSLSLLLLRIQPTAKNHLGSVRCLSLNPANRHQLLIGYEQGVISLWDLEKDVALRNYPQSVQDCQQVEVRQLACLSLGGGRERERAVTLPLCLLLSPTLSISLLPPTILMAQNFPGRSSSANFYCSFFGVGPAK